MKLFDLMGKPTRGTVGVSAAPTSANLTQQEVSPSGKELRASGRTLPPPSHQTSLFPLEMCMATYLVLDH